MGLPVSESGDKKGEEALPAAVRERLAALIDRLGGPEQAAKIAGVSKNQIFRWKAGTSKPPLMGIARLAEAAGRTLDWLLSGEEADVYVPLFDVEAAAGAGAWNEDEKVETMVPFSARFLREIGANLRHLHLIRAKGGSMEPLILDGDWLLVDISQTDPRVSGVYVIRRGGHLLVKHVQPRPKAAAFFVYSENPQEKKGELVREDDLDVIGRVLWIMRRAG